MIDRDIVSNVDLLLDSGASYQYQTQPLAQDWARVAKIQEEAGEAIAELISLTGQNPRKGIDPQARQRLLQELADTALTGIYAIQHFTKDIWETERIIRAAQDKHINRLSISRMPDRPD